MLSANVEDSMYLSSFCFMGCEYLIGAIALVVLCALIAKSSIPLSHYHVRFSGNS